MKILHICLANYFVDNYSYQENMLTKYHKYSGNEVYVIASLFTFDSNGKGMYLENGCNYINEHGIEVTRLEFRKNNKFCRKLRYYKNVYSSIEKYCPDVIFIHNVQFMDIKEVVRYLKKHPYVKVYADNHADFMNSAANWVSRKILHGVLWKRCAKMIEPFVSKFYGVLPARVDFLKNVYGLPEDKVELLVMGADDEKVDKARNSCTRDELRKKYNVSDDDFLIITGGKIDRNKPETLELMKVVSELSGNIRLMVFGSVVPELKNEFDRLLESENIIYIGWINSNDVYDYYTASDLAFFPGKHSVLWEQAVGLGIPCVFRKMPGFTHVDLNGNCVLLDEINFSSMKKCVENLCKNKELYAAMKRVSLEKGMNEFSYKKIAEKSIQ